MNTPELETERLRLRKFTEQDISAIYAIFSDKEVNTYLPWYPLTSVAEAKTFYEENFVSVYAKSQGYAYAICLKSDGIPIGYIHVSPARAMIWDMVYAANSGIGGIAAEAARAVIHQVKEDGFPYVTATHDVNNPRSGHVMQAVGMRYQYSYEEMWQPKNFLVTFRMYQLNLDGNDGRVYRKYWDSYDNHFVETL